MEDQKVEKSKHKGKPKESLNKSARSTKSRQEKEKESKSKNKGKESSSAKEDVLSADEKSVDGGHQKEEVKHGNSSSVSGQSSELDMEKNWETNAEYLAKQNEIIKKRLILSREWIIVVMLYYLCRLTIVILPRWSKFDSFVHTMLVLQSIGMGSIFGGLIYSYTTDLNIIKVLLYLEAVIMASANFNEYNRDDLFNYEGLNMLSTLFSVIFVIFNIQLANLVVENNYIKMTMMVLVYSLELGVIIFTNFKIENMTTHTTKAITLAVVFLIIMIPKFSQINNALIQEQIFEAKLSYQERDMYKQMFDGLQEGVIVCKGDSVTFMNELSNMILSHLFGLKDFFKKINDDHKAIDINRMEVKMFYLFQNNAQESKSTKKSKKSHTSSDYPSSAVSKEEQTEFSVNDILKLTTQELTTKVFTFEKKLVTKDITKMNEVENQQNLDAVIKNLPSMKNIDDEYIPKFKFFQIKRSHVKGVTKEDDKTMICFIDISQKILYDTSKAEGEFLSLINSTISHEMRNPLNSIINQCKIIQAICLHFKKLIEQYGQFVNPQILQELQHIYQQVQKGNIISTASSNLLLLNVEDILGYAQLKAGKFTKNIKTFNIKRAVEDIRSIQEYQAQGRNIEMLCEFIGFKPKKGLSSKYKGVKHVPLQDQNLLIESDEKRIKQVLMNLQSNALKFTREGGKIQIIAEFVQADKTKSQQSKKAKSKSKIQRLFAESFSSNSDQSGSDNSKESDAQKFEFEHNIESMFTPLAKRDKLVISVIDSGIGIKAKDKIRLFKLFGCLNNTRQMNTQGIGLGLVISENIVKSFDGRIGVKSKFNKGSMFTFSIVLGKDDDFQDLMKQNVVLKNQDKVLDGSGSNRSQMNIQGSYTDSSRQIANKVSSQSNLNSIGSQNVIGQIHSREGSSGRTENSRGQQINQNGGRRQSIVPNEVPAIPQSVLPGNLAAQDQFYSTDDEMDIIPDDVDHLNISKVYQGPRSHQSADIQKYNSMRMKAKRHKLLQNVQPHIDVSDIELATLSYCDDDNGLTDPKISNNRTSVNNQLGMKLTTFSQMTHSMPITAQGSRFSMMGRSSQENQAQFPSTGQIKPLFQKQNNRKAQFVGKILIVDDEKFNCDIIEGFLMILGFQNQKELTEFAYNGEQAVRILKKAIDEGDYYKYSLILMDCNMPFMDGYEATKRIRKLFQSMKIPRKEQPKIVAITGHVENEYIQRAINSGMDKVYPKPLPIKEFGQLLMSMKFIDNVPEHLRADDEDEEY